MFAVVLFSVYCLFKKPAPIGYNVFPPDLQKILDERISSLALKKGVCIAGRVSMSDGKVIRGGKDVLVNLREGIDEPLRVYNGGWFIMRRTQNSVYAGGGVGFILRSFGYDPIDASVTILDGELTYLEFVMQKTANEKLAKVIGAVVDENDEPVSGARVSISFPFANLGTNNCPYISMTTDSSGKYLFDGLSVCKHSVAASAYNYSYHSGIFTPVAGEITLANRKLYAKRRIIIDYVYQANGSRDFTDGNLNKGSINWVVGRDGVDFSQGHTEGYEPDDLRDLDIRQDQSVIKFRNFYVNGRNGFYDAGLVDFDSVTEADNSGYSSQAKPCLVGHVYVVKTYEEDNYAKFIVRSIEKQ